MAHAEKMIQCADEIAWMMKRMDLNYAKFEANFIPKNVIAMRILQIRD